MEIASLQIAIDSRQTKTAKEWLDDLSRSGERAEKSMGKVGAGGKVAATGTRQAADASRASARAMDTQASSAQRLISMIRSYAAAMVGAFGVREIVQAADSWQGLENRLRLVTQTNTQLRASMNDVYSIAQRTSSTLDSTAQVYQRFAQNAGGLGLTMADVARVTETVSKAVAYSGSTAAGAEGALIQFGQALASGALRGEELQSVLDGASGLAQALADGMGVPVGALKDLASEGKITADTIVTALTRAKDSVDDQFNTRIKTVGQSFTELGNAVTRYIGEMSGATGASNGLAGSISSVADAIDRARANMDGLHRELDAFRTFGELVSEAWGAVDQFGKDLQEMLGTSDSDVRSLGDTILTSFEESFLATAREVDALHDAFFGTLASLGAGFRTLGENIVTGIKWAFDWAKFYFDSILFEFQQVMAATTGQSYDMRLPSQPESQPFFKSMREEADKARQAVEGTLGVTAALQARLGTKANWRSFEDAFDIPLVDEFGKALGRIPPGLDKTGKALSAAAKAAQQFEQQRRTYLRSQYEEISNLSDQADALEDQVRYYGLSESALNDLTIARLRDQQAVLQGFEGAEEEIAIRERMIEQYQRIGIAMQGLEAKEAEKAAWAEWERSVEGVFSRVQQSLTDAIFDGGKSGRDLVKDLFRTLTVDLLINPVMKGFQQQVTASMGGMFGYQNEQQQKSSSFDFNQFMGGGTGNMLSSAGNYIGSTMVAEFGAGLTAGAGGALTDASASALMNIGTNGSSSFAAGSSIGGIGLGSIAGYGSAIMNLAEGNYGSAAGAAIGTYIMPGIGTAVGSLLGGFADDMFGGGPPRTRHGQRSTSEWIDGRIQLTGMDSRQSSESQAAAAQAAQAAVTQANEMFARLGVDAAIESFYAIMESSVLGDRQGVASGGMLRTGDRMRQIGIPQASDMTFGGFGGWSSAEMLPRLATDIQLTVLEAFQQIGADGGLPDVLYEMVEGVFIRGLDESAAQQLAQRFSGLIAAVSQFQEAVTALPFEQLRGLSFDAAAGLVEVAGGLESLTGNLNTYYNEFYTEAERNANTLRNVAAALEEVGVALPDTRQQFRALVEAQDLTTDAGRRVYAALLNVSGAFASVTQSAEQAAQEQQRIAQERRDSVIRDLESAYSAVVSAGQAEIARLQQTFGATDTAMNSYRSAVQALESEFGSLFTSIDRYISDLRGNVEASAQAQYRQARAVISTALATGQLPQTADLTEALQVAQRGVTSQVYGSLFEQNRAYAILANEMEALKGIAEPELDAAKATLAQLEEQYALLRGTNRIAGDSLSAIEQQVRLAFSTEEAARSQISLIEQQLETAKQQYEELMGINSSITDLAAAIREFAAAAAAAKTVVSGGGGGGGSTGGWTPGNLPAGAENLTAAERYVLYNTDLLQDQAGSGMSIEQYAQYHWNTYGKFEGRDIGLSSYAVGTDFVPHDMTANIHRGEIIINPRDSDILRNYGIRVQAQGGDSREVVSELRALREQNARLERRLASIEQSTGQLAAQFDNVTAGGNAMATEGMV